MIYQQLRYIMSIAYDKASQDWANQWFQAVLEVDRLHPDELNWEEISSNPNVTWDIVKANHLCNWSWFDLSRHPNITWDIIEQNPNYPWDFIAVAENPNVKWDVLVNKIKKWRPHNLSKNPNLSLTFIKENLDYPWDWWVLSENPCITCEFIEEVIELKKLRNKYSLENHHDWNFEYISRNPNLTVNFIKKHLHQTGDGWDWEAISCNPNITWEIIQQNPNLPWDYYSFCEGPNMNWDIAKEYFHKEDWGNLAHGINIHAPLDIIEKYPEKNWDWEYSLNMNVNLTKEFVDKHLDKFHREYLENDAYYDDYDLGNDVLSGNQAIDWDIVKSHPEYKWSYYVSSGNSMKYAREKYIRKHLQNQFRHSDLHKELIETFWHPKNMSKFQYLLDMDNDTD